MTHKAKGWREEEVKKIYNKGERKIRKLGEVKMRVGGC